MLSDDQKADLDLVLIAARAIREHLKADGPNGDLVDVTVEPPCGSQVTDEHGSIWERCRDGWTIVGGGSSSEGISWLIVRNYYRPLRPTTDADRKRVGLPVQDDPAPADDLPGEPVEPGDLRAGDKVEFTYRGERIACALVSSPGGMTLFSDAPGSNDHYPNVVDQGREWCGGISDVRLIERAPREGDGRGEALAMDLYHASLAIPPAAKIGPTAWDDFTRRKWLDVARAAREHIEVERKDAPSADVLVSDMWKQNARAEKAEAERDEARAAWGEWKESSRAGHAHATDMARLAEEWKAKYAALREDVQGLLGEHWMKVIRVAGQDILDRDAARDPLPDPDTVTLRRDDVEALFRAFFYDPDWMTHAAERRVRAALGWGDEA